MKLIELMNARNVLDSLAKEKVSAKLAYPFAKFISETESDAEYYEKQRNDIVLKYALPPEEQKKYTDGQIHFKPEVANDLANELKELGDIEIDQPNVRNFTLDELNEVKIEPRQMFLLLPVITEE